MLIVGAVLTMRHFGVLNDVTPIWIGIGVLVAVGIGIMLALSSGTPATVSKI